MSTLENEVLSVIQSFINNGELFTALDVSNKVKMVLPLARHRDVRDTVRALYHSDIVPGGYARTPITVMLSDGSSTDALLYHPLSDSFDLDNKYDSQKRSQAAVQPSAPAPVSTPVVSATVDGDGTLTVQPTIPPVVADPSTVVDTTQLQAKDRWAQLFNSQPSLFPRK